MGKYTVTRLDQNLYKFFAGSGGYGHYELHPSNPFYHSEYFTIVLAKNYNIFLGGGEVIDHSGEIFRVVASLNNADYTKTFWATLVRDEDYKRREKDGKHNL